MLCGVLGIVEFVGGASLCASLLAVLDRPGGDLLSHVLRRSTIGAEGFHGRVRDGIGWFRPRQSHQVDPGQPSVDFQVTGIGLIGWFVGPLPCLWGFERRRFRSFVKRIKPIERLVRLSFAHCCASTCLLSTSWSTTALMARPGLEGGFPLRCLQRLSRPHLATRRCGWRHNRSTRGASIPVLSY